MGNCLVLLGLKPLKRPVTLLLVGLDSAGKTTAAKGIVGEKLENVAPTLGFVPEVLQYRGCDITLFDLGGGAKLRPVWTKYFAEVHGVIFVIDSSATLRVTECRKELHRLLAHKRIAGKPVLILANKQDVDGAMDEMDIVEQLEIERVVNKYKCPTRVETCSALTLRKGRKPDQPIADGFRWLVDTIVVHYTELHARVERDQEREHVKAQRLLDEAKERIRHLRAERERQERLQALKDDEGGGSTKSKDEDVDVVVVPAVASDSNEIYTASESGHESEGPEPISASEAQELNELGFSTNSLRGIAADSDGEQLESLQHILSAASRNSGTVAGGRRQSTFSQRGSGKSSPCLQVHSTESTANHFLPSPLSPSPHEPVRAVTMVAPLLDSPELSDPNRDSGFTATPNNVTPHAVQNGGLHLCLDSSDQDEGQRPALDAVPIDSDDELFNMDQRCSNGQLLSMINTSPSTSPQASSRSNGSVTAYVREQLELQGNAKHKRKSFLKRYHKTAPQDSYSSGLPDT